MDQGTDKLSSLKKYLGFKSYDVVNTKEQTIINYIKDTFEVENIQFQYSVLGYRIDLYFHTDILTEILIMKLKDKKHQKKNLLVYLLELILKKKI